jgi:hypothetical protein
VHLSAEQVGHEVAAVGHVQHADAAHHHEQLAEHMGQGAIAE